MVARVARVWDSTRNEWVQIIGLSGPAGPPGDAGTDGVDGADGVGFLYQPSEPATGLPGQMWVDSDSVAPPSGGGTVGSSVGGDLFLFENYN